MIEFAGDEDFRTIGLRPMEYRPMIIRRAMSRSAMPLVELHLKRPDPGVERRLSEIITLGYHLLDPRRRNDSLQRMMLGRVHPQLSDEAVRMAQAKGSPLMVADGDEDVDTVLAGGRGLLVALAQGKQGKTTHQVTHSHFLVPNSLTPWSQTLQSFDLSVDRSHTRYWQRLARLARQVPTSKRSVAVVGICLMLGLWLVWPASQSNDLPVAAEASLQQPVVAPESAPVIPDQAPLPASPVVMPASVPLTPVVNLPASQQTLPASTNASANAQPVTPENSSANNASQPLPSFEQMASAWDSLTKEASKQAEAIASLLPSQATASDNPATIPDLQSVASAAEPNRVDASVGASTAADPATAAVPVTMGVPAVEELTIPEPAVGANEATPQWPEAAEIKELSEQLVSLLIQAQPEQADEEILRLASQYRVSPLKLAGELLHQPSRSLTTDAHSLAWIDYVLVWAGRAVLAGEMTLATQFVATGHSTARTLSNEPLPAELREWSKTLETMERLAETAAIVPSNDSTEGLTAAQKYAVGRYWVLVRRDWRKGLPFLCSCSDAMVSKTAIQETLLSHTPTASELIELATAYVSLAEKSKGWMHDSYILHVDQLLSQATIPVSRTESLKLSRYAADFTKRYSDVLDRAKSLSLGNQSLR